ncbi:hypothetical protein PPOP_1044, partial [Paenibacillus popilliae ATCC 14706]
MTFEKQPPKWLAKGVEPPESKKESGWAANDRPPADYFNWQMFTTYEALQELQEKAAEKDDVAKALKDARKHTDQSVQAITPESIGAETPSGAQAKANQAEANAKEYANKKVASIHV